MKKISLIIFFASVISLTAYNLTDKWLYNGEENNGEEYDIYIDSNMKTAIENELTEEPIKFDLENCINQWKISGIKKPVIGYKGENNTASPLIKYDFLIFQDQYGTTERVPTANNYYDDFTITINSEGFFLWNYEGGGYIDENENKIGGVDINTVLIHELGHAYGLYHENKSFPVSLMSDGEIHEEQRYPRKSVDLQEVAGMKAQYEAPIILDKEQVHETIINEPIRFKVQGHIYRLYDQPPNWSFHGYVYDPNLESTDPTVSEYSGYYKGLLSPVSTRWIDETTNLMEAEFEIIPKIKGNYKFKVYTETSWNDAGNLEAYEKPESKRAFDEIEFRVNLKLKLEEVSPKYDYTIQTVFNFEATLYDIDGQIYPNVEHMSFYYAKPREEYADEIPSEVVIPGKYACTWDTENPGVLEGDYIVKATAIYFDEGEAQTYDTSDLLTMRLIKSAACVIDFPKEYTSNEAWDFEFAPSVTGGYFAETSLEDQATFVATLTDINLDPTWIIGVEYDDYEYTDTWSGFYLTDASCPQTKRHWPYYDFRTQWNFYANGLTLQPNGSLEEYPFASEIEPIYKKGNKGYERESSVRISEGYDDKTKSSKSLQFYGKNYLEYYFLEEHLYPGVYRADVHAYDSYEYSLGNTIDLAQPASVDFLLPEWKLKILNDNKFWDMDESVQTGPTYIECTEYNKGEDLYLMIWRPFEYHDRTDLSLKINNSSDGSIVYSKNITTSDYFNDTFTSAYTDYLDGGTTTISKEDTLAYHFFKWNTGELNPGFYTMSASETDIKTGAEIVQKREFQVCPLYEQWENHGDWSLSWPEPVEDDTDYWRILDWYYYDYEEGKYSLESHYETIYNLSETEISCNVAINDEHPALIDIVVGLRKDTQTQIFDELTADFQILFSTDGEDFTIVKSIDIEKDGFSTNNWTPSADFCFVNFTFPIGKITNTSEPLKIKLRTIGKSSLFTNNINENDTTMVLFDEIKLWYLKNTENRPKPTNLFASQAKELNTVILTFEPPVITDGIYPEKYFIYRDGKKIGETISTSFTDGEIGGNEIYNYVVVASYGKVDYVGAGLDYPESSMLDCSIYFTTQPILYPRPGNFTLTKGIGTEDNCVTLAWTEPDPNVISYEIIRNGEILAVTKNESHNDSWLDDGEYTYYLTAIYGIEGDKKSEPTLPLTAYIYSTILPIHESFEHNGELPYNWINYTPPCAYENPWVS